MARVYMIIGRSMEGRTVGSLRRQEKMQDKCHCAASRRGAAIGCADGEERGDGGERERRRSGRCGGRAERERRGQRCH